MAAPVSSPQIGEEPILRALSRRFANWAWSTEKWNESRYIFPDPNHRACTGLFLEDAGYDSQSTQTRMT